MPDPYREPIEGEAPVSAAPVKESTPIESEILELERQLAEKKAALGERPLEQIMEKEKTGAPVVSSPATAPASPVSPPQGTSIQVIDEDAKAIKSYEKNQQLKALVDLAFSKGVQHATEVVRNLDNPYLMDEFHDTLVDKLHEELVKRGKLEEV